MYFNNDDTKLVAILQNGIQILTVDRVNKKVILISSSIINSLIRLEILIVVLGISNVIISVGNLIQLIPICTVVR